MFLITLANTLLITFIFTLIYFVPMIFGYKIEITITVAISAISTLLIQPLIKPQFNYYLEKFKRKDKFESKKEEIIFQKELEKLEREDKSTMPSMMDHHIFIRLQKIKQQIEYDFTLEDKTKEAVFRDILFNKTTIWEQRLKLFANFVDKKLCYNDCVKCQKNKQKVIDKNLKANIYILNEGVYLYNNYFINNSKYSDEEVDILKYGMDHFNVYHSSAVERMANFITDIHNHNFFFNCIKSINSAILSQYQSSFESMLIDAAKTLNNVNGYFKNKVFKDKLLSSFDEDLIALSKEFKEFSNQEIKTQSGEFEDFEKEML